MNHFIQSFHRQGGYMPEPLSNDQKIELMKLAVSMGSSDFERDYTTMVDHIVATQPEERPEKETS